MSPLLCSGCANSAGSRVAPSRSSIAGRRDAASASPKSRPSSSGSRSMSLSRREPRQSSQQSRRHRSSRSSSRRRGTRLASAWSQVWRDRAATSPACRVQTVDLAGKRLELLREVVPGLRRLAIMANVGNPGSVLEMGEVQAAARTLGLEVAHIRNPATREDIAPAFEALKGRSGCTLCLSRPARNHQPDSHQHLGAGRATANDARFSRSTSKREV